MIDSSSYFLAGLSLALLSALSSCGGNSSRDGEAADGGSAGSISGSAGRAGASASGAGGAGAGGSSGAGGSMGGAGHAGAGVGGQPSASCSLPKQQGECDAAFTRYYHDAETGACEAFVYGGCGGNENNFETMQECEAACGASSFDACEENSDCIVTTVSCCGVCGASTLDSWTAINAANVDAYRRAQMCDSVGCPAIYCPPPPPDEATDTYFAATCEAGRCKAIDLRATAVTECDEPSDCSLRHGVRCCEGCGDAVDDVVALSDEAALSELVCAAEPAACPPCVPLEPQEYAPDCVEGRCVVTEKPQDEG